MDPMDTTPTTPVVPSTEASSSASTPSTQQQDDPRLKGISPIKPEYLIPAKKPIAEESLSHLSEAVEAQGDQGRVEGGAPSAENNEDGGDDRNQNNKRDRDQKHVKNNRKKRGGQNQDRVVTRRVGDAVELCFKIAKGNPCEHGDSCKFNHDIKHYLANKDKDLGDRCVNFDIYGECHYGYKCRFLGAHMDAEGKLIRDEEKMAKVEPQTLNQFPHELTIKLRSYKFDFKRSEEYIKAMTKDIADNAPAAKAVQQKSESEAAPVPVSGDSSAESPMVVKDASAEVETRDIKPLKVTSSSSTESTSNSSVQEEVSHKDTPDVPLRASEKKRIDFRGKTYLAPLTTVGNLPFRRICKGYGVDITCGEMAMAANLVQGQKAEVALLKRHKSEDLFGVQLTGNKVDVIVRACDVINQTVNVDFVDLNMGCPIDLVYNAGSGSGLMNTAGKVKRVIAGMKSVLDVPVTVKYRMGVLDKKPIATTWTPMFHDVGAALGTLHGRSRQQRYTKLANWDYIKECALTNRGVPGSDDYMPLFGNGDILGPSDYHRHLEEHKVDGCMIARGALMKPWIFDEIKTNRDWDISSGERFDMMKQFCDFGLEHWGSDTQGVNQTRRFLLEWQSFLHRYVPVGLLEVLPQRINDRPPAFVGRNDLETLMASPDVTDWIKLSDMILGPAPEAFRFDPKHKANSTSVEG